MAKFGGITITLCALASLLYGAYYVRNHPEKIKGTINKYVDLISSSKKREKVIGRTYQNQKTSERKELGKEVSKVGNLKEKAFKAEKLEEKVSKIDIKTDLGRPVKEAVDTYKSQISQEEEREKNNAKHLFDGAEELNSKLKYDYREWAYDATRDTVLEAEKDLKEAEHYLDTNDYKRSSQYAERALEKFSRMEKIIDKNEDYWDSLEEKHKQLDMKMCYGSSNIFNEEQEALYNKLHSLYIDAKNILQSGTWLEGGYASRKNLDLANTKMDEAFNLMERIIEIDKTKE